MKSNHITGMERMRSINLRIGFAAAILLTIFALNWTSKRTKLPVFEEETYPTEVALKPFTVNQPRQREQPPVTELKPNDLILAVTEPTASLLPSLLPVDTAAAQPDERRGPVAPTQAAKPLPPPMEPETPHNNELFVVVEEMPRFPGCEDLGLTKQQRTDCATNLLLKFLYAHIRYPEMARQNGIEGTVYLKFVVERDGSIADVQVLRDIGGGCGAEALRVLKTMPHWLPGKQRGRAVRVQFTLPVKFSLS